MAHDGIPDLLVGYQGKNYLIEIKDGTLAPSKHKLADRQIEWHGQWLGQAALVASAEEAIAHNRINLSFPSSNLALYAGVGFHLLLDFGCARFRA